MKTLVWTAPRVMALDERPVPDPGPDEVLIRVTCAGICGSELNGYLGHNSLLVPPLVFGHEFSGVIAALGRPRGDHEFRRQRPGLGDQRVIAADLAVRRQPGEHALAVVVDRRGLAVHQPAGAHDAAAEGLDDGLVAEAHAEHRHAPGERADHVHRHARVARRAGPRRDAQVGRRERQRLVDRDLVVAAHVDLGAEHEEGLHQVVGERVVVVDEQQPRPVRGGVLRHGGSHDAPPAIASARAAEPLLAMISSYSLCGTLSATMPAPAW